MIKIRATVEILFQRCLRPILYGVFTKHTSQIPNINFLPSLQKSKDGKLKTNVVRHETNVVRHETNVVRHETNIVRHETNPCRLKTNTDSWVVNTLRILLNLPLLKYDYHCKYVNCNTQGIHFDFEFINYHKLKTKIYIYKIVFDRMHKYWSEADYFS